MTDASRDSAPSSPLHRLLSRIVDVRPQEVAPLGLGVLCYFFLLFGYYILRPMREAFGVRAGSEQLPYLMLIVMGVMLCINPFYSALVAKLPRSRFIPLLYRGLIALLLVFFAAVTFLDGTALTWAGWVFYVFLSVFNLFVVSIFWSLLSDLFDKEASIRLFACVAVGGSLGAICGSLLTSTLVEVLGRANLILISCVLLECAARTAMAINRRFGGDEVSERSTQRLKSRKDEALGGSRWAGIRDVFKSPYLLGISGYMILYGLSSTFAYFIQGAVVEKAAPDDETRTQIFGYIDVFTNVATLVFQVYLTSRMLRWLGPALTLMALPIYSVAGFVLLSSGWFTGASMLTALVVFQVLRRALAYGVSKPAREMLYTILPPEQKYKSKNLVDLAMPRTGDALGAVTSAGISAVGMGLGALALTAVPVSLLWMVFGGYLGRAFKTKGKAPEQAQPQLDSPQDEHTPGTKGS